MHFSHHPAIRAAHPELVAGALYAHGVRADANADAVVARYEAIARERPASVASESELPEIQAWRRAFQRMGLKPTQYRCASESLLRRLRLEGSLPRIHPLIDTCNAISVAFATPVAVLDLAHIEGWLQVRPAEGSERYLSFGGTEEHPEPGEVSFVDAAGNAHARRWTHRQSGLSAVRQGTREVLVVAEALHPAAARDMPELMAQLQIALGELSFAFEGSLLLTAEAPKATRLSF